MSDVKIVNPPGTEAIYKSWKFAQATVSGNLVQVAGQVGIAEDNSIPESIEEQTRLAFEHVRRNLEAAGSSLDHVMHLTQYFTDIADVRASDKVFTEFFPNQYPARTVVQVSALVLPGLKLEVQASAVLAD